MAKIKKKDLEFLSSDQLRKYYTAKSFSDFDISPMKEFIQSGVNEHSIHVNINRIKTFLQEIIVERFLNGSL